MREARVIAALNHPHIYSTEEAGSISFLTMELVQVERLDKLIPASGLPVLDSARSPCRSRMRSPPRHQKHISCRTRGFATIAHHDTESSASDPRSQDSSTPSSGTCRARRAPASA